MRNRKWSKRELLNAGLYLVKTGTGDISTCFYSAQFLLPCVTDFGTVFLNYLVELPLDKAGKIQNPLMPLLILSRSTSANNQHGFDGVTNAIPDW